MNPIKKHQLAKDREQVARVLNFLRSEPGAMSAVVVLESGTAKVYRDGRVSFQPGDKGGAAP